jgi:hypothetical protein
MKVGLLLIDKLLKAFLERNGMLGYGVSVSLGHRISVSGYAAYCYCHWQRTCAVEAIKASYDLQTGQQFTNYSCGMLAA